MQISKFELVLTIIFVICLVIGTLGTIIYKKFKQHKEVDEFAEALLTDNHISEQQADALLEDMANSMIKAEDYEDKDEQSDEYIEY